MNGATFLMLMQSMRLAMTPTKQDDPPVKATEEKPQANYETRRMRYVQNDPLQLEVRALLKQKYQ